MTLRTRLTLAFLVVVLGPVLLGAVFVGTTVTAVNRARAVERVDRASGAVRDALDALCAQLRADAAAAAVTGEKPTGFTVQLRDAADRPVGTPAGTPAPPWAVCGQSGAHRAYTALAARAELRDKAGLLVGYAYAVRPVDTALLDHLAEVTGGATVTVTASAPDSRYARPVAGPLPLSVSVPAPSSPVLLPVLFGAVLVAAFGAVAVARWLALGTTQPLAELAAAADRVAGRDLSARVPVRTRDEVGRLASTFNRMTREMQSYVAALTASRDQLRGQLGLLGDTLSSTHDLQRILDVILQTARAATGAESGVVLLLHEGELVGPGLRLPVGAGLLGTVAKTGVARRGRVDRDGPVPAAGEPVCRTYMAVPFSVPDAVTGVLALYDRVGGDEFDDADLVTLRTFAGQAAIAVENVRVHEEAQRLSHTDPLTSLYNYRTLKDSLRREVERASRFGHRLCVLALDLDRFKDVNDSYGHAAGDVVLVEFARRVRAVIREVDLAFRRGGEEFVVLLPETDALGGIIVAERLNSAIRDSLVPLPGRAAIPVTVSIGIAVYPEHGATGPQVLEVADDALYQAKAGGRDRYRLADPVAPMVTGGASGGPHPALPLAGR